MKKALSIIAGFIGFLFLVIQPIRANLIASLAIKSQIDPGAQTILLAQAYEIDPCETGILNVLGDNYFLLRNYPMAAIFYGRALNCSPGNALMRFKDGETLLMMGFDYGRALVGEAVKLEPHNPVYLSEANRLTRPL